MAVHRITPREVYQRMQEGESFTFIDARTPEDWGNARRKLPGAVRVPVDAVDEVLGRLDPKEPIVVYCASPNEASSALVALRLDELGYAGVHAIKGGFEAWENLGYPDEVKEPGTRGEHGTVI